MHCYEFLLDLMNMTVALNSVKSNDYTPRIANIYIVGTPTMYNVLMFLSGRLISVAF